MNGSTAEIFIDGTSALKKTVWQAQNNQPRIIPFPRRECATEHLSCTRSEETAASRNRTKNRAARISRTHGVLNCLSRILNASEMFCSLKREDARGVLYNVFSRWNIWTLAAASFVVAVMALGFGA